jgi:hypothetical protein
MEGGRCPLHNTIQGLRKTTIVCSQLRFLLEAASKNQLTVTHAQSIDQLGMNVKRVTREYRVTSGKIIPSENSGPVVQMSVLSQAMIELKSSYRHWILLL